MAELYYRNYHQSKELKLIYSLLYPKQDFEEFIARSESAIRAPFSIGFHELSSEQQILEPDYEFRQILYFLKPAGDLLAFREVVKSWQRMLQSFRATTKTQCFGNAPPSTPTAQLIPFASLIKTAEKIEQVLTQYFESNPQKDLFPLFDRAAGKKGLANTNFYKTSNPMFRKGCSRYPLYSISLNDLGLPADEPNIKNASVYQHTNHCCALLTAYIYLCSTERRLIALDPGRDPETLAREEEHRNPYLFLSQEVYLAPDRSKLCDIDRILRKSSKTWFTLSPPKHRLLERIINRPYQDLARLCTRLLAYPIFDESLNPKDADLKLLLQFFSETRRVHGSGTGNSDKRDAPETPPEFSPGNHNWELPPSSITQEEDDGILVDVFRLPDAPINPERLQELEALGEGPYEDLQAEDALEILFMEEGSASQLKLDKYTSHSQLLLASKNQALAWDLVQCTHEEMQALLSFVRSKSGLAPLVIVMMVILAIDLEMALNLEIGPTQSWEWLKGGSRFRFNGYSDRLRACSIQADQGQFSVWVYPIPFQALRQHADIRNSSRYLSHSSAIAFTDYSDVAKELIQKHSDHLITAPVAAFTELEKIEIATQCAQLIKEFNQQQNQGMVAAEGKRNITIKTLREYGKSYLINLGFERLLVEALDWKAQTAIKPALHYFTADLWEKPKNSKYGLQYHLANRTALFYGKLKQDLPGIANHTICATGLVDFRVASKYINTLIETIGDLPKTISNRTQLERFIQALNAYSFYIALWFCIESSHRPHHIPFIDVNQIDPMHGLVKLNDKSDPQGNKLRLAWLSERLRIQMMDYADTISQLISWAQQHDIEIDSDLLIYLELDQRSSNYFCIKPLNSTFFAQHIGEEMRVESNFYRKFMASLLQQEPHPVSLLDIERWLGHWMSGTAPYHLFSSASSTALIERVEKKVCAVMAQLGFKPIQFTLPHFQFASTLMENT